MTPVAPPILPVYCTYVLPVSVALMLDNDIGTHPLPAETGCQRSDYKPNAGNSA